jgi:outer membrane protein assembly factor BamB
MFRHDASRTGRSSVAGSWSGLFLWSYEAGDSLISSPAIDAVGTLYQGSIDNTLYALTSAGTFQWSYVTADAVKSSPAVDVFGYTYVGSDDNAIYSFTSSGALAWSYDLAGEVFSSPAPASSGSIAIGSLADMLYRFDSSGALQWSYGTGEGIQSSPAINADGTVYVGADDNNLYSFLSDGSFLWSYTAAGVFYASPALDYNETVYAGSADSLYYAFFSTGVLRWSYATGDALYASGATDGYGEGSYAGSYDNNLYAFSSDGVLQWSYDCADDIFSSPAVDSYKTVYVGSAANRCYAFKSDGSLRWSYEVGGSVSSSPVIDSESRVYFGADDNRLYAISPDSDVPVEADIVLNGSEYQPGDQFEATFILNSTVSQVFNAYAAFFTPAGKRYFIYSNNKLSQYVRVLAANVAGLRAGFQCPLVSIRIPSVKAGEYRIVVAFFKDNTPGYSPDDALLWLSESFTVGAVVTPTPTPSPVPTGTPHPQAVLEMNAVSFYPGDYVSTIFRLNEPIERFFTVYAVIILPNGAMRDARTLQPRPRPRAETVPGLRAPFECSVLAASIPRMAPRGEYEIVVAFFDPWGRIHGLTDAFFTVNATFTVQE